MNDTRTEKDQVAALLRAEQQLNDWSEVMASRYADGTRAAYLRGARLFVRWLAYYGYTVPEAGVEEIRKWREYLLNDAPRQDWKGKLIGRGHSPGTVNLWLAAVRRFYDWLIETGMVANNPASGVGGVVRPKRKPRKKVALTPSEVRAVLEACGTSKKGARDLAMISLMAYCALRPVEVQRAALRDLQTADTRLQLRLPRTTGTRGYDRVILPAQLEEPMRAWIAQRGPVEGPLFFSLSNRSYGKRLSLRQVHRIVRDRFRSAGVAGRGKTPLSLRITALQTAIRNGANPLQVQALARHRSVEAIMQYYRQVSPSPSLAQDLIDYSS